MNSKERKSNFDMMRVLCILLIIMYHYVTHGGYMYLEYIPQKLFYVATGIWGLAGVLGFIMISSHFLYSSGSFSIQKVLRITFESSFYSTLITLALFLPGLADMRNSYILECFFSVFFKQYWFITFYLIFYLMTPFLKLLCDRISIQSHRLFLIVFFLVGFLLNNFVHIEFISKLGIFVYTYILIAYFIKKPDNFFQRNYKWLSVLVFGITVTAVCAAVFIDKSGNDVRYKNFIYDISSITSALMLLSAVCMYFIFRNLDIKHSNILAAIGNSTLGIYLIHEHGIFHYFMFERLLKRPEIYGMTAGPLLYVLSCIGALIGCTLIYRLFEFILKKTVYGLTNKYLKKRYESFDCRYVPGKNSPDA